MSFRSAFEDTVGLEGGFGKDPDDSGNWTGGKIGVGILKGTKYGISAAAYPDLDIENLTIEQAHALYKRDYWDVLKLDSIPNERVQEELFDTGVNMGIGASAKILQRSINFLEMGNPLDEDGAIGPKTIEKAVYWCNKDPEALYRALNGFQFIRYYEIAVVGSVKEKYARGWMKRIQDYRQ